MQFEQATAAMDASKAAGRKGAESEEGASRVARISYAEASRELIAGLSSEALAGIVREEWSSAPWLKRAVPALRPKLRTPEMRGAGQRELAQCEPAQRAFGGPLTQPASIASRQSQSTATSCSA